MKAYTDIKQSKKLAKILPIESADMNYWCGTQIRIGGHRTMDKDLDVPCWSLSALIELMPDKISINNESYYLSFGKKGVEYRGPVSWDEQKSISSKADNLVDACYEMIIKLHKFKVL